MLLIGEVAHALPFFLGGEGRAELLRQREQRVNGGGVDGQIAQERVGIVGEKLLPFRGGVLEAGPNGDDPLRERVVALIDTAAREEPGQARRALSQPSAAARAMSRAASPAKSRLLVYAFLIFASRSGWSSRRRSSSIRSAQYCAWERVRERRYCPHGVSPASFHASVSRSRCSASHASGSAWLCSDLYSRKTSAESLSSLSPEPNESTSARTPASSSMVSYSSSRSLSSTRAQISSERSGSMTR